MAIFRKLLNPVLIYAGQPTLLWNSSNTYALWRYDLQFCRNAKDRCVKRAGDFFDFDLAGSVGV